jgi:hypothetical protein
LRSFEIAKVYLPPFNKKSLPPITGQRLRQIPTKVRQPNKGLKFA